MVLASRLLEAAERHHSDAGHLGDDGRHANADQLNGFAAECAIKAVLLGLTGLKVHEDGPVRPYREHVDRLWPLAAGLVNGLTAQHYAAQLFSENVFVDWSVDHRYASAGAVAADSMEAHRKAASSLVTGAQLARQDGLL